MFASRSNSLRSVSDLVTIPVFVTDTLYLQLSDVMTAGLNPGHKNDLHHNFQWSLTLDVPSNTASMMFISQFWRSIPLPGLEGSKRHDRQSRQPNQNKSPTLR